MTNNKDSSSFENTIESIERQLGIVDPNKQKKKLGMEIVVDEYGRFWQYNDRGTIKWRVNVDGSAYHDHLKEEMEHEKRIDAFVSTIKDGEVRELMEEEALYFAVGGSASQWQQLERKKEDARKRGKIVPPLAK